MVPFGPVFIHVPWPRFPWVLDLILDQRRVITGPDPATRCTLPSQPEAGRERESSGMRPALPLLHPLIALPVWYADGGRAVLHTERRGRRLSMPATGPPGSVSSHLRLPVCCAC